MKQKSKTISKQGPKKAEEKNPEYEFPKVDIYDPISSREFEILYSEVTHGSYKFQH